MDNVISCEVNNFTLNQKVIFPDGKYEMIALDNLPKYLSAVYHETKNIDHVHFFGNEIFIYGLIENIKNIENTNFNQNIMKFEVN